MIGPNVDSLSIDPDSVSGKNATAMMLVTALATKSVTNIDGAEDFSFLVTNLTTFLTTNRIIVSSDDNEDTKCKKDRFMNQKTVRGILLSVNP